MANPLPRGSERAWLLSGLLGGPAVQRFGLQREVIDATGLKVTGLEFLDLVATLEAFETGRRGARLTDEGKN